MTSNNEILVTQLPEEIIERILSDDQLTLQDAINFFSTCTELYLSRVNCSIWKIKSLEKWPTVGENRSVFSYKTKSDWLEAVQNYSSIRNDLMRDIKELSHENCLKGRLQVNDLFQTAPSTDAENSNQLAIMIDELHNFLNDKRNTNFLYRYHAKEMLTYLKRRFLIIKYEYLKNSELLVMENFLILVNEWTFFRVQNLQTEITLALDEIAQQVEENLRDMNPLHSIFSVDKATRREWQTRNIQENQFNFQESKEIFFSLFDILFGKLGFTVCRECDTRHCSIIEHAYINKVLECKLGDRFMIVAIFAIIARKFGLLCKIVKENTGKPYPAPQKIVLYWQNSSSSLNQECYFIAFNEVQMYFGFPRRVFDKSRNNLRKSNHDGCKHEAATFQQFECNLSSRLRSNEKLDEPLTSPLCEDDLDILFKDVIRNLKSPRLRYEDGYLDDFNTIFTRLNASRRKKENIITRTSTVKFAVGMVVRDTSETSESLDDLAVDDSDDETCVILEWYKEPEPSHDVYYKVLQDNWSAKDVPQDSICLLNVEQIRPIKNEAIGRYFSEFNGWYYQPSEGLAKLFPDDLAATEKLAEIYGKNLTIEEGKKPKRKLICYLDEWIVVYE